MIVREVAREDVGRIRRMRHRGPEVSQAIGARVSSLRLARGWTVRELADRTGLSVWYVHCLDTGRTTGIPNAYTLAQLAQAFGVTLDWLYFGGREE